MDKSFDKNLEIILNELKNLPQIEPPADFHAQIMEKVRREANKRKKERRRNVFAITASIAAAAVIAIIIGFPYSDTFIRTSYFSPAPQNETAAGYGAAAPRAGFDGISENLFSEDNDFSALETELPGAPSIRAFDESFAIGLEPNLAPLSLEEQFDYADTMSISGIVMFPENLPTDDLIFHTNDRFSINFVLRINVDDYDYAYIAVMRLVGGYYDAVHSNYQDGRRWLDIPMVFEYEELPEVFAALYSLGIVEEYSFTVTDTWAAEYETTPRAMIESRGSVTVTIISAED